MQWSVPRELIWAIIFGQAVFIVALWPSHYPYGQTTSVRPQHQSENSVGGSGASEHSPALRASPSDEQEREHSGEHASEVTILGIKPGEWLLSIVTLMLWGATVRMVRSADRTAERQLRAYIDIRQSVVENFVPGEEPLTTITFRNVGQTPALNVKFRFDSQICPFDDEPAEVDVQDGLGGSKSNIGARGIFVSHLASATLTEHFFKSVKDGKSALFANGMVRYDDIFGRPHFLRFRLAYTGQSISDGTTAMETCRNGNTTDW